MTRVLIAVLLAAAPAFAHDRDDGRWHDDNDGYGFPAESQDPSWGSDDGYGSWDGEGYAEEASYGASPGDARGPSWDDFRRDRELSWNGEWIETPEYGTVWRPTHVAADWQPYTDGRWVWTNAGWAWASDEPFGWAVYHYGRWAYSPAVGWMWVPGRVWAPAWVSWRWNDGYAAWCPMGPRGVVYEQPALWVVVPSRQFLDPVRHHVIPVPQRRTIPLPRPTAPRFAPGPAVVERATGRSVRPLAVGDASVPRAAGASSGSVVFYRPRTAPIAPTMARPARGSQRPVQERPVEQRPAARPWYGSASPAHQSGNPAAQPARPQAAVVPGPHVSAGVPAVSRPPASAPVQTPRVVVPNESAPRRSTPHVAAPVAQSAGGQHEVKER